VTLPRFGLGSPRTCRGDGTADLAVPVTLDASDDSRPGSTLRLLCDPAHLLLVAAALLLFWVGYLDVSVARSASPRT
jgi:hypothetical protein